MSPSRQRADKLPDPDEQLAGGELGESHRGDGAGGDAFRQQHRDTPGQHSGLARACPCLHQEGAVVDCNRGPPGVVVPKRSWWDRHHGASQTCAAAPRRAVAASLFRSQ